MTTTIKFKYDFTTGKSDNEEVNALLNSTEDVKIENGDYLLQIEKGNGDWINNDWSLVIRKKSGTGIVTKFFNPHN